MFHSVKSQLKSTLSHYNAVASQMLHVTTWLAKSIRMPRTMLFILSIEEYITVANLKRALLSFTFTLNLNCQIFLLGGPPCILSKIFDCIMFEITCKLRNSLSF